MRTNIAVACLILIAIGVWWWEQPKTPKELFEVRCSVCHALPDLVNYEDHQIPLVVKAMRERNGASEIIDEQEAEIIVNYIRSQRSKNEQSSEGR